jgi:small subunit ribosomal protein S20
MPNTESAKKRQRQEQKRRTRNRMVKSIVKTNLTRARQAIATPAVGSVETAEAVRKAISELDRAAKKGVIHKNNAARRKSRLMKQLNAK